MFQALRLSSWLSFFLELWTSRQRDFRWQGHRLPRLQSPKACFMIVGHLSAGLSKDS